MKTIYVFNTENEMIFESKKKVEINRKFGTHYNNINDLLATGRCYKAQFHFSYDKNFIIPEIVEKPKLSKELSSINAGKFHEAKVQLRRQAKRVLEFAKAQNKPARYVSSAEAVRASIAREFRKKTFVR